MSWDKPVLLPSGDMSSRGHVFSQETSKTLVCRECGAYGRLEGGFVVKVFMKIGSVRLYQDRGDFSSCHQAQAAAVLHS